MSSWNFKLSLIMKIVYNLGASYGIKMRTLGYYTSVQVFMALILGIYFFQLSIYPSIHLSIKLCKQDLITYKNYSLENCSADNDDKWSACITFERIQKKI